MKYEIESLYQEMYLPLDLVLFIAEKCPIDIKLRIYSCRKSFLPLFHKYIETIKIKGIEVVLSAKPTSDCFLHVKDCQVLRNTLYYWNGTWELASHLSIKGRVYCRGDLIQQTNGGFYFYEESDIYLHEKCTWKLITDAVTPNNIICYYHEEKLHGYDIYSTHVIKLMGDYLVGP